MSQQAPTDGVQGPASGHASTDDQQQGYRLGEDFAQLQYANIMMVDDEPLTMEVVQTFLEDAGYRKFVLIEDSVAAMDALREHRPDVLLLDVMMPEVSGFDILQELRKDPDFQHLPVVILTSSSDAATKLQALDLGATDFLSKPVDPSELALRVRNTLAAKAYQDQLAYYDVLTNLPNRRLFHERMEWAIGRAQREQQRLAALHVSFSDFKRVADAFGPGVGDTVLRQLAERLVGAVGQADPPRDAMPTSTAWDEVFRLGSADFALLVPLIDGGISAAMVGQRLIDAMREPLDADGTEVYLAPSIGVAGYPDDAGDAASLVRFAVAASSQAIAQGGGRLQFYSATMNEHSLRRLQLEADLRRAVDNDEFRLLYQPKVSLRTGRIRGAEALIRWHQPDGGVVSPADFIPVAEDSRLILPIGEWVLREACAQITRWRAMGINMRVSVNISSHQFFGADLVGLVRALLAEHGFAPDRLVLEITESILIDRVDEALDLLRQLRGLGVRISIDDFGTGYSSFSYLKRFQVDEVKIDRAFITDIDQAHENQALVHAVTYLAHELGFRVCAEGVETEAQLGRLRETRCDEYQGFLFSRPVPAEAFIKRHREREAVDRGNAAAG